MSEDNDRLLAHYLRFLLREESGPLRERLQNGLVERALKTSNPRHTMTVSSIQARIAQLTSLSTYPQDLVTNSLDALCARGDIERAGKSARGELEYRLTQSRWDTLERALSRVEQQEQAFRSSVVDKVERVHGPLSKDERRLVENAFTTLVGNILTGLGERSARTLIEKRQLSIDDAPNFGAAAWKALSALPSALQETARQTFEATLRDPSREEREHLYAMGQGFYVAELLHLDPELQVLQRARFEETHVYLDTNLLIDLVIDSDPRHTATTSLVRLCAQAGLQLHYGAATAGELERLIASADDDFKKAPIKYELAHDYADLMENPFVAAFLRTWQVHRLSWGQYRASLAAWSATLDGHGVTLDTSLRAINSGTRFEELKEALIEAVARSAAASTGTGRRQRTPRALEHDAGVIAGVESLISLDTSEAHPFGHRYWFVTMDRRLARTAREAPDPAIGAVAMLADEWMQYVGPFLSADVSHQDAADVFSALLSSRLFVSLGAGLTLDDLRPFTTPEVSEILRHLDHDERCHAVAKAAQAGVFARARGDSSDEAALRQLGALVEHELAAKTEHGELIPRETFVAALTDRDNIAKTASAEQAARIEVLEQKLASAQQHNRTSVTYALAKLRAAGGERIHRVAVWASRRKLRIAFASAVLCLTLLTFIEGWLGTAVKAGLLVATLVSLACTDLDAGKKNAARLLGR